MSETASMPATLPLCGHTRWDSVIAWTGAGQCKTMQDWWLDVQALAQQLPPDCRYVLNVCHDRYQFLVAFAAGVWRNAVSLQPSSLAPSALEQVIDDAAHTVCVHDGHSESLDDMAQLVSSMLDIRQRPALQQPLPLALPDIPSDRVVAKLYTSGSTGVPVGHIKTWGGINLDAKTAAMLHGLDQAPACMVGTVPSQHMYGFESVMMVALLAGCSVWAGRPFFPADMVDALNSVPVPRVLVTSPAHLRVLVQAQGEYAPVVRVLCATAPLSLELAQAAEQRFAAPLVEVYGSTENNQLALRRTVEDARWRLFPNVTLEQEGDLVYAFGGHVQIRMPIADLVEMHDAEHFTLLGRKADVINIAGRRTSLAYLNHQLARVAGVEDGAFFLPKLTQGQEAERLCLLVCAPGMTAAQVLEGLRPHMDSVFLPRPLILLPSLPRNETGKLPQQTLQNLYDSYIASHQGGTA